MLEDILPRPQSRTIAQFHDQARLTILVSMVFALLGALFGLVLQFSSGGPFGIEAWLIASCVVVSAILVVVLTTQPFERIPWVPPVASIYFLFYLSSGALLALSGGGPVSNFLVYLLWFFVLFSFNRFVNRYQSNRWLSLLILVVPIAIVASELGFFHRNAVDAAILIVYCLSYAAFATILSMFSRYREALIREQARSHRLEEAERLARLGEERFRMFAGATSDTIWEWDFTDRTLWRSDAAGTEGNTSTDVVISQEGGWMDPIHPDDRARVAESLQQCVAGSATSWSAEYRRQRADGSMADVISRSTVVRDASGKALRMVGGITDISEIRLLEAKLRHVQRLEAIGRLTGGVAHDFNNLLTVILGNTETLADGLAWDEELGPLATMAHRAAERGAELTKRLLAFARQQTLDPRAVDVNRILAGMKGLMRRTLTEDIDLAMVNGSDDLWLAYVDAGELENAVLNLVINARDAMPGGGRLTIETSNTVLDDTFQSADGEMRPGPYVVIAVSDTGIGMSPEVLARVFEPFYTTKSMGSGNGLGLSMVHGYVKQSNGHIRIYSEVGQGTTVRMYLPRAQAGADAPDAPVPVTAPRGGSERILVVEDDHMVQDFVASQLRGLGYTVTCVDNGAAALELLRTNQPFELLFTDVVMPGGLNGKQLVDAALQLRPGLPALFTSGYAEDAIVHHGRLDPGVRLLNKPYSRSTLASKIREILDANARPEPPASGAAAP